MVLLFPSRPLRLLFLRAPTLLAFAALLALFPLPVSAQQTDETPSEELVVNFAAGRVIVAVVKDAIVIATVENPIEPHTLPPIPIELYGRHAGIVLGAVEWLSPASQLEIARLDKELPRLRGHFIDPNPHLEHVEPSAEATDVEAIGQALMQRLKEVVGNLHAKLDWPPDEPVVQLLLINYIEGYGGDVWLATFTLNQEMQRIDYYDTRISHPHFTQFWPPEKGQPHTLLEFQYPPENPLPNLLDLLRQKDPRLEKLCDSDKKMRDVADHLLEGQSGKILAVDVTQFLRAALGILAPPNARETMADISIENGFEWILRPPPEPNRPTIPAPTATPEKERPPDAPTLVKPSSP
jgi:hypothetical protein